MKTVIDNAGENAISHDDDGEKSRLIDHVVDALSDYKTGLKNGFKYKEKIAPSQRAVALLK